MPPALVIFDCDGVLVDSEPLAAGALKEALDRLGLPFSRTEVDEKFRGKSLSDIVEQIERSLGRAVPDHFLAELDESTFAAFRRALEPVPGVYSTIERIVERDLPICVASSGSVEKMRLTLGLTNLLSFFEDHLYSANQVSRGKPAPDLFLHAAAEMGADIVRAAVIEDSLPGVTAGVSAGARVLAYVAPNHPDPIRHRGAVTELGATAFSHMEELPALLGL
jgi:HAD superfamily hydrolase (TIGR01509 family)